MYVSLCKLSSYSLKSTTPSSHTYGAAGVWPTAIHVAAHAHHLRLHLADAREDVSVERVSPGTEAINTGHQCSQLRASIVDCARCIACAPVKFTWGRSQTTSKIKSIFYCPKVPALWPTDPMLLDPRTILPGPMIQAKSSIATLYAF